jgi:hypothetical protein
MTTTPRPRILRVLRLALFLILALIVAIPFGLGFLFMQVLTVSGCDGDVDPAVLGIERDEVRFASSEFDGDYEAYFIGGEKPATIIIAPTLRAGRGDRMEELRILHDGGYNILTYRARTCFGARHSLGYDEATAIGDALAYLATRPDVDQNRIGIYGFSAGGAATLSRFRLDAFARSRAVRHVSRLVRLGRSAWLPRRDRRRHHSAEPSGGRD